jgi:hypothetical protein
MKNLFGLEKYAKTILALNTPKKVQDFLNSLDMNFEPEGDTCFSPKTVLERGEAHCIEGAILGAMILRCHGYEPLLLDLETNDDDFDHVVALFKKDGYFGALSKTNHAVLRYREPVYKSVRELAMSYFHEYFLNKNGFKTLRTYSVPVNLKRFDNYAESNWVSSDEEVWFIPEYLTTVKHYNILSKKQLMCLRKADEIEINAGKITEFKDPFEKYIK